MPCQQVLLCHSCFEGPNSTVDFAKNKATGEARRCRLLASRRRPPLRSAWLDRNAAVTHLQLQTLSLEAGKDSVCGRLSEPENRLQRRRGSQACWRRRGSPKKRMGDKGAGGRWWAGSHRRDRGKEYNHLSVTYASLKQLVTEATLLLNSPRGRHKTGRLSLPGRQLKKDRAPPPA